MEITKITSVWYKKTRSKNWYKIQASCNHDKIIFFKGEGCKGFLKEILKRCKADGGEINKR